MVDIKLSFPRPTGKNPSSFVLTLLDSSNSPVNPQPYPFGYTLSIDPHSTYEYFNQWTVGHQDHYKLRVNQGGSSFPTAFVIYDLQVTTSGGAILQESDILRGNNLFHLIYLSSQADITLTNTLGPSSIQLYPMEHKNNLLLILSPQMLTSSDSVSKTYQNLAAGFYGVSFGYNPSGSAGSTSFQSHAYNCPSTKAFTDKRGVFLPCAGQGQQAAHVNK